MPVPREITDVAEKLRKASRILGDPSKMLGLDDLIDRAQKKTSNVEREIKRILGFITGGKKK